MPALDWGTAPASNNAGAESCKAGYADLHSCKALRGRGQEVLQYLNNTSASAINATASVAATLARSLSPIHLMSYPGLSRSAFGPDSGMRSNPGRASYPVTARLGERSCKTAAGQIGRRLPLVLRRDDDRLGNSVGAPSAGRRWGRPSWCRQFRQQIGVVAYTTGRCIGSSVTPRVGGRAPHQSVRRGGQLTGK